MLTIPGNPKTICPVKTFYQSSKNIKLKAKNAGSWILKMTWPLIPSAIEWMRSSTNSLQCEILCLRWVSCPCLVPPRKESVQSTGELTEITENLGTCPERPLRRAWSSWTQDQNSTNRSEWRCRKPWKTGRDIWMELILILRGLWSKTWLTWKVPLKTLCT